jgi:hypothetical protein
MYSLLFILTVLSLIVLSIVTIIAAIRHRPVKKKLITITIITMGYSMVWVFFYLNSIYIPVPLGTDICFDDWCATITKIERQPIGPESNARYIAYVTMANHARGIAQKPDEPRIYIVDSRGNRTLATQYGKTPLNAKLQLHQSLQTTVMFTVPANSKELRLLIEEGPFIANFVFPEDQQVFVVR